MTPPPGYHIATKEELDCLPDKPKHLSRVSEGWVDSAYEKGESVEGFDREDCLYAVPDAPTPQGRLVEVSPGKWVNPAFVSSVVLQDELDITRSDALEFTERTLVVVAMSNGMHFKSADLSMEDAKAELQRILNLINA